MERHIGWITILVILANGAIFRRRALALGAEEPTKKDSYLAIARGFVVWLLPPIVLWAVGVAAGWSEPLPSGRPTPFDYVCYAAGLAIVVRSCIWVYREQGAEYLAQHRRIFDNFPSSARGVKLLWALMSIGTIIGVVLGSTTGVRG